MDLSNAEFILSVHSLKQLPDSDLPEIAFAGRSNVGKSSLLNVLLGRKNYVKVSSKPGKTQGLNFFEVAGVCNLVDLPGYGYAKVSKRMQADWGKLISARISRPENSFGCVVVIMDIRHEAKQQDRELLAGSDSRESLYLAAYTKADKLSGNARSRQAALLDAGHGLRADERLIFSAATRLGRDALIEKLASHLHLPGPDSSALKESD
jgi:GTP-binding protein